jgi:endo-1,4-beta-xylanase
MHAFALAHNATFRGHNTFWHEHLPAWLPGNVSASDLVNNVIPQHVQQEIQGMGYGSSRICLTGIGIDDGFVSANVTSWDVVNEIVGDGVSAGMTALQCVQQKGDWPTVTVDGGSTPLVKDLSFVHAAFTTALKYAPASARLAINDYSTGGTGAKTACLFPLLADVVANASVPYSRLAVAFQSHVSGAPGKFVGKTDLAATFAQLDKLGAHGIISELDVRCRMAGISRRGSTDTVPRSS